MGFFQFALVSHRPLHKSIEISITYSHSNHHITKVRYSFSEPNSKWFRRVNVISEPLFQTLVDPKHVNFIKAQGNIAFPM